MATLSGLSLRCFSPLTGSPPASPSSTLSKCEYTTFSASESGLFKICRTTRNYFAPAVRQQPFVLRAQEAEQDSPCRAAEDKAALSKRSASPELLRASQARALPSDQLACSSESRASSAAPTSCSCRDESESRHGTLPATQKKKDDSCKMRLSLKRVNGFCHYGIERYGEAIRRSTSACQDRCGGA